MNVMILGVEALLAFLVWLLVCLFVSLSECFRWGGLKRFKLFCSALFTVKGVRKEKTVAGQLPEDASFSVRNWQWGSRCLTVDVMWCHMTPNIWIFEFSHFKILMSLPMSKRDWCIAYERPPWDNWLIERKHETINWLIG